MSRTHRTFHRSFFTSSAMALAMLGAAIAVPACAQQRSIQAVRQSGDWAFDRGQYELALQEYTEVAERHPSDWRNRLNLGKTLLVLNRPAAAKEHLAIAETLRPQNEEIVDLLAQAMLESGDRDGLFRFLRARVEQRRTEQDYQRLGYFAMKAGDADEAEKALITAARLNRGQTIAPQLALADFYMSIGDESRAMKRLRMALYIEPANQKVQDKIRALGEVPGPSFAVAPEELEQ